MKRGNPRGFAISGVGQQTPFSGRWQGLVGRPDERPLQCHEAVLVETVMVVVMVVVVMMMVVAIV